MLATAVIPSSASVSPFVPAGGALLLVLAAGVLLWALGGRLLRPGLAIIGLIVGLPIGIWIGGVAAPEAPAVLFAAGGAVAGLVIACISYGLALASVTAVLAGVLALLGAWSAADLGLIDAGAAAHRIDSATGLVAAGAPTPYAREALTQLWLASGVASRTTHSIGSGASSATGDGANAASVGSANGADGAGGEASDDGAIARTRAAIEALWNDMPQPRRTLLLASLAAGSVVGLLFGLLFADAAARLVTSLAGSLLLLVAGMPLLTALLGRTEDLLPLRPSAWFAALGMLTIIGYGVQRALAPPTGRAAGPQPAHA